MEKMQTWSSNAVHALCKGDEEGMVAIEAPPSPVDVNPTSPTPPGEEVDDDPSGLPNVVDSGYEPIVSTTVAEFVVQDQYLESNTDLFNKLVARWGKEKALYPQINKRNWTFMIREVLDRMMTPELQAEFNWGGMLGALSTHEKSKFQNTTHSKLVMQVVTLRTRLFPNPYCREAELMQVSEMHACTNRSNERWKRINKANEKATTKMSTSKAQFQVAQREKANEANRIRHDRRQLKRLADQNNSLGAEFAVMNANQ